MFTPRSSLYQFVDHQADRAVRQAIAQNAAPRLGAAKLSNATLRSGISVDSTRKRATIRRCRGPESNRRHMVLQTIRARSCSAAMPGEWDPESRGLMSPGRSSRRIARTTSSAGWAEARGDYDEAEIIRNLLRTTLSRAQK